MKKIIILAHAASNISAELGLQMEVWQWSSGPPLQYEKMNMGAEAVDVDGVSAAATDTAKGTRRCAKGGEVLREIEEVLELDGAPMRREFPLTIPADVHMTAEQPAVVRTLAAAAAAAQINPRTAALSTY